MFEKQTFGTPGPHAQKPRPNRACVMDCGSPLPLSVGRSRPCRQPEDVPITKNQTTGSPSPGGEGRDEGELPLAEVRGSNFSTPVPSVPPNNFAIPQSAICNPQLKILLPSHPQNPPRERAFLKNKPAIGLRARRAGWRGATREHIRKKSVTEEPQRHPACSAARLLGIFFRHALTPSASTILFSHLLTFSTFPSAKTNNQKLTIPQYPQCESWHPRRQTLAVNCANRPQKKFGIFSSQLHGKPLGNQQKSIKKTN